MNLTEWQSGYTPHQQDLHAFLEAAELLDEYDNYKYKEKTWKDLSVPEKKKACTRQSGQLMTAKLPNGHIDTKPIYCNLCERCYQANALKLKDKVDSYQRAVEKEGISGEWRRKTVDNGTEAQSLKKRISRNQGGRHFEVACNSTTNDIYVYVVDEPGKDMDSIYGSVVDLSTVDYEAMYKANRATGKRMSNGAAFKCMSSPGKENTIRVMIPHLILDDKRGKAEEIIRDTNYLELADTAEKAKKLYNFQLKYIIKELKKAGIKILAVEPKFYNFEEKQLLDDWNRNVKYWMSIQASYINRDGANTDILTSRLYQRVFGGPETLKN